MKQESKTTMKKMWRSMGIVFIALVAIASLTYAWFVRNEKIVTLIEVTQPDSVTILGPNAKEMERLDLSYTSEDIITDESGKKVVLNRIICVQSTAMQHRLEIIHTTNMKGLTFTLYPVTNTGDKTVTDGDKSGNSMTVSYDSNNMIQGSYLNVEKESEGHKYANQAQHVQNYGDYSKVQTHAEPVYWLTDSLNASGQQSGGMYHTYYVLSISWTEDAKETDVFYILAKTEQE